MNILVVDDEPAILKALETILGMDGHCVHTSGVPSEALERVRAAHPVFDLMITDQTMPDMNGPDLARAVKTISPATRVALLTGLTPVGADTRPGIDYVLPKPIRLAELRKFMSNLA